MRYSCGDVQVRVSVRYSKLVHPMVSTCLTSEIKMQASEGLHLPDSILQCDEIDQPRLHASMPWMRTAYEYR